VSLHVGREGALECEPDVTDLAAFYARLREDARPPTTSQPSVGEFLAVYEPLLAAGHEVLSVHLASTLSGTYATALQARDQLGVGERIAVVDAATTAGGLGMVVLAGARAVRDGATLGEAAERTRAARERMRLWFCLDGLEHLRRGGRIGAAQAWLGGALRVKPILSFTSEIVPVERVRTSARAFERMVAFARELRDAGQDGWVVQHAAAHEQAQRLVERGREVLGCEPLFVSEIGPVIGAHLGPRVIGVGGLPRSLVQPAGDAPPAAPGGSARARRVPPQG
jgi:DegV family protein with EDD domain